MWRIKNALHIYSMLYCHRLLNYISWLLLPSSSNIAILLIYLMVRLQTLPTITMSLSNNNKWVNAQINQRLEDWLSDHWRRLVVVCGVCILISCHMYVHNWVTSSTVHNDYLHAYLNISDCIALLTYL